MQKAISYFKTHRFLFLVCLTLLLALLVFLRRPDALITPQFWGEDGRYWYADAYNHGKLHSLFIPYAGSLQLAMRFVGSISLLIPFRYAPLFFTLVALVIQLLPAILINTKRFSPLIMNSRLRLLVTFFYILIPSSFEIHANLTNINWHLALIAFMIIVAKPSRNKLWRIFDITALIATGLTGPFSIILAFIALLIYYKRRNKYALLVLLILGICALEQIIVLALAPKDARLTQPLEPGFLLFLKIIGARVATSTIIGSANASKMIGPESILNVIAGVMVICTSIFAYLKAKTNLRLFILFSWAMLAAALLKPQASDTMPQWHALLVGAGSRYFFFPILCFFLCLLSLAVNESLNKYVSLVATCILLVSLVLAVPVDFRYPNQQNLSFSYFVGEFKAAPVGTTYCLPINPGWNMCLNKH